MHQSREQTMTRWKKISLRKIVLLRFRDVHGVDVELRRGHLPLCPCARCPQASLIVSRVELRVVCEHHVLALCLGNGCNELLPESNGRKACALTLIHDEKTLSGDTYHASGKRWDVPSW